MSQLGYNCLNLWIEDAAKINVNFDGNYKDGVKKKRNNKKKYIHTLWIKGLRNKKGKRRKKKIGKNTTTEKKNNLTYKS